jgi:hypothetical protein
MSPERLQCMLALCKGGKRPDFILMEFLIETSIDPHAVIRNNDKSPPVT